MIRSFIFAVKRIFRKTRKTTEIPQESETAPHLIVGQKGEALSCQYLKKKGYKIYDKNYVTPFGELDIIAGKQKRIHIVEVKTFSRLVSDDPRVNLTPKKIRNIVKSGLFYQRKKKLQKPVIFDAVIVILEPLHIEFYENILRDIDCDFSYYD